MAEASRALQSCLKRIPIPVTAATVTAAAALDNTNNKETSGDNSSTNTTAVMANKESTSVDNDDDNDDDDTSVHRYLDTPEALHQLLDKPHGTLRFHQMLLMAASECQHPLVGMFVSRMLAAGTTNAEAKAGLVLFQDLDKSSKLKLVFEVLAAASSTAVEDGSTNETNNNEVVAQTNSDEEVHVKTEEDVTTNDDDHNDDPAKSNSAKEKTVSSTPIPTTLDQAGARSLFATILTAISCCVYYNKNILSNGGSSSNTGHSDDDHIASLKPVVTVDSHDDISAKDSFDGPPKEMTKTGETSPNDCATTPSPKGAASTTAQPSLPKTQVSKGLPEDLKKDIAQSSAHAARSLMEFSVSKLQAASCKSDDSTASSDDVTISFEVFGDWYNQGGCQMVPWLELLHLSKWKISHSHVVPSAASHPYHHYPPYPLYPYPPPPPSHLFHHHQYPAYHHPHYPPPPPMSHRKQPPPPPQFPHSSSSSSNGSKTPQAKASLSHMLQEDEIAMRHHRLVPGSVPHHAGHSPGASSRTVVMFDFSSSMEANGVITTTGLATVQPLCINVSEESLWALRRLVYCSGLIYRSAADVCKTIMHTSHKRVWDGRPLATLRRDDFCQVQRNLISPEQVAASASNKISQNRLSSMDEDNFGQILEDYFAFFEGNFHQSTTAYHPLSHDEVNAKELAVGFCFLCAGSKSTKLATAFELLDDARCGFLTQQQLMRFLRSILTMMAGTSFLRDNHVYKRQPLSHERKEEMRTAVENGAQWTLQHFLKHAGENHPQSHSNDAYSFEIFAEWYSKGGYNVAPWLELLDLNKLLSLLGESESFAAMPQSKHQTIYAHNQPSVRECRSSHRRQHHARTSAPTAQVLFTFPLADQRSLIVLREDAIYVRGVVEQLGALDMSSNDIWLKLLDEVKQRPGLRAPNSTKPRKKSAEPDKNTLVDQSSFIQMMEVVLQPSLSTGRKRSAAGMTKLSAPVQEMLSNFFHSYDLKQTRVVPLNELMGGLSLLCGGKKSTKLAFAFGAFDGRPQSKKPKGKKKTTSETQSLDQRELYLFLRSFLIVLFSCCCQTLDMSDASVDRYIAKTARMVADDVMRYQWNARKLDRIDFDQFGEWYNEGGFEIAPWLELLDLRKWVLVDDFDALDTQAPPTLPKAQSPQQLQSPGCPPPPPEDVLDSSFFEGGHDDIMNMDSMDEMDIMLMPSASHDKSEIFPNSPAPSRAMGDAAGGDNQSHSLKFHLLSEDDQGGFMLSISQKRIRHLRQITIASGLPKIATETACAAILKRASGSSKSKGNRTITQNNFNVAVRDILGKGAENHQCLSDVLSSVFEAFDFERNGKPNALELACGFSVLCRGKKSDKLEYAFELLDKTKAGVLSKEQMYTYMRSFLTVLLAIACTPALDTDEKEDTLTTMNGSEVCDRSTKSLMRAVEAGSNWAVVQAFKSQQDEGDTITFDDFAQWYTEEGHISIPWIELLALRKWLI